jgi:uncharacterized protein
MRKATMNSLIPDNPTWLAKHVIFVTVAGSHMYGTNIEGSDIDYRGVCTLPANIVYGFMEDFEQTTCKDPDLEIYSIVKFARLAVESNPNVLELVFCPGDMITSFMWGKIYDNRHKFLSKRIAATFAGYARSQLKRIKTHRAYLLNPVKEIPTREEFGLPERSMVPKLHAAQAAVQKGLDQLAGDYAIDKSQQIDLFKGVAKGLGFDTNFIELLYKEKKYGILRAEKEAYDNWAKSRNPKRRVLEEKCGYDSKHLMHLVRIYRECIECLESGDLVVKRPDATELVEIRNGSWPFSKVETWAEDAEQRLAEALAKTKLPARADLKSIDKIVQGIVYAGTLRSKTSTECVTCGYRPCMCDQQ